MSIPVIPILVVLGLFISAKTRLNAVVFGQPVSIPVLGIIATVLVLGLAVLVLYLVRSIVRDGGLYLRPRTVPT